MSDSSPDNTTSTTNHCSNSMISKIKIKKKKLLFIRVLACFLLFGRRRAAAKTKTLRLEDQSIPTSKRDQEMRKQEVAVVVDGSKEEAAVAMRRSVKQLHFGGQEEKVGAAAEIKKMAGVDRSARRMLAELGVIPSLVEMVVVESSEGGRLLAVEALIELASGNFTNKALIVEAGLLAKIPTCCEGPSIRQELALLLLSISSLAKTPFPLASSHILPFITQILNTSAAAAAVDSLTMTCLATLYNLSTKLENTVAIVTSGAIHALLTLSTNKTASQGALATLSNLVPTTLGRKAMENDSLSPEVFIKIMGWDDKPGCQEIAVHVLMVLAHQSVAQRRKMAEMGIVQVLLELALLGTPLAQKRALKIMQWFKAEGQAKMGVHSGPQAGRRERANSLVEVGVGTRECRRAIKRMVKQSLDMNMELIVRRANGTEDVCSLKALAVCSSSKSLPY